MSHFGSSHFSQSGCDAVSRPVQEVPLFVFCVFVSRGCMPRKGWSTLEVPAGWLQVIRGPRPPAVQWPKASRGQGQFQKPPVPSKKENKKQTERKVPGSENRRGPPQVSPAAQDRVLRLQTAVNALGDDDSPEAKMLRDALRRHSRRSPRPQSASDSTHALNSWREPRTDF